MFYTKYCRFLSKVSLKTLYSNFFFDWKATGYSAENRILQTPQTVEYDSSDFEEEFRKLNIDSGTTTER